MRCHHRCCAPKARSSAAFSSPAPRARRGLAKSASSAVSPLCGQRGAGSMIRDMRWPPKPHVHTTWSPRNTHKIKMGPSAQVENRRGLPRAASTASGSNPSSSSVLRAGTAPAAAPAACSGVPLPLALVGWLLAAPERLRAVVAPAATRSSTAAAAPEAAAAETGVPPSCGPGCCAWRVAKNHLPWQQRHRTEACAKRAKRCGCAHSAGAPHPLHSGRRPPPAAPQHTTAGQDWWRRTILPPIARTWTAQGCAAGACPGGRFRPLESVCGSTLRRPRGAASASSATSGRYSMFIRTYSGAKQTKQPRHDHAHAPSRWDLRRQREAAQPARAAHRPLQQGKVQTCPSATRGGDESA